MSSDDFERRLHRLFAEAPPMPDESVFAAQVQHRLDQGETVRRLLIGLVGGLGAVVATGQLLSANLGERVDQVQAGSLETLRLGWNVATRDASALVTAAPMGTEMVWTVAALGALALAFLAARLADQP